MIYTLGQHDRAYQTVKTAVVWYWLMLNSHVWVGTWVNVD